MGMFDWVDYEAPCLRCTHPLTKGNFQSKDHDCQLEMVPISVVHHFYASCPKCGFWNEYRTVPPKEGWTVEAVESNDRAWPKKSLDTASEKL